MNSIIYVSDGDAKVIFFKGVTHKLIFISINHSVVVYSYITFWIVFFFNFLGEEIWLSIINIFIFFIAEEEVVVAEGEIDTVVVIDTVVAIAIVVVVAAEVCNNQQM